MGTRALIMAEPPAQCCFRCEYCYVPPGFDRRNDKTPVSSSDFIKLAERTGADNYLFWMASIGEPFMRPDAAEVFTGIALKHKIVAVTSLGYHGDDTPELLCDPKYASNVGMYWSIHYNELLRTGTLDKTVARVRKLLKAGVRVWPTLVMHPSYLDNLADILELVKDLGLKLIPCRYRNGQQDLAALPWEDSFRAAHSANEAIHWGIWDNTANCWKTKGHKCNAGISQVVVDAWWNICNCHGDKNKRVFGVFPRDAATVNLQSTGTCISSKCPCKHSVYWGSNEGYPHNFSHILNDWKDFAPELV